MSLDRFLKLAGGVAGLLAVSVLSPLAASAQSMLSLSPDITPS